MYSSGLWALEKKYEWELGQTKVAGGDVGPSGFEGRKRGEYSRQWEQSEGKQERVLLSPCAQASTRSLEIVRFISANKAQGLGPHAPPHYLV